MANFYGKDSNKGKQIMAALLAQMPISTYWAYEGSYTPTSHQFSHSACGFNTQTGVCVHGIHENARYITVTTKG